LLLVPWLLGRVWLLLWIDWRVLVRRMYWYLLWIIVESGFRDAVERERARISIHIDIMHTSSLFVQI
jgi:hypothetical protein